MKTAILASIILELLGIFFIMFIYIVFSIIISIFKNIGKDKFIWYGQPLDRSYAKSQAYDSFGDMMTAGFFMSLKMGGVCFVFILVICIYIECGG